VPSSPDCARYLRALRAVGRVNFIGHDHVGLTVYDAFKVSSRVSLCE
jgi:hypothetical protein